MNKTKTALLAKTFYLIVFSVLFEHIILLPAIAQDLCSLTFTQKQYPNREPIIKSPPQNKDTTATGPLTKNQILSEQLSNLLQNHLEDYQSQKGYVDIANKYFNGYLIKAFRFVSSILEPTQFKKLKWREFHGSTQEFYNIQKVFLNEQNEAKKEFIGIKGYMHFAEKFFDGYMTKAFINVSAVFGREMVKKIGWHQFNGTSQEARDVKSELLNSNGNIKSTYIGMQGFALFAEFYFKNDMNKTYRNVLAAIGKKHLKQLKWKSFVGTARDFIGTTKDFDTVYHLVVDENNQIKKEFIGSNGLIDIAKKHYSNNVSTAYSNISAVLDKAMFQKLKWKTFNGHTKEYLMGKNLVKKFESINVFIKAYSGTQGHIRIADELTNGNMNRAYGVISLVLKPYKFKQLNWTQFTGTTEKFNLMQDHLLDKDHNLKEEFIGTNGYVNFADLYTNSQMIRAFTSAIKILGSNEAVRQKLQWKTYLGNSTNTFKMQQKLLKDEESIKQFIEKYKNMNGHIAYANKYLEGNLRLAIESIKYFLNKEEMQQLQWKKFFGYVEQLKLLIEDFNKNYPKKWQGFKNQTRIANKIFNGHLYNTYKNTLDGREYLFGSDADALVKFQKLKWKNLYQHGNFKTKKIARIKKNLQK